MRQVTRPVSCGASPALAPQTAQLRTCSPCPGPFLPPRGRACTRSPLQSTSQRLLQQLRVARVPPDGAPPSPQSMPAEGAEADAAAKETGGQVCLPCLGNVLRITTNVSFQRVAKYAARQRRMHQAPTTATTGRSPLQRQARSPAHAYFPMEAKRLAPCMPCPSHASTAQSSHSRPHTARQTVSTRKAGPRHGKLKNTRSKTHAPGHDPESLHFHLANQKNAPWH